MMGVKQRFFAPIPNDVSLEDLVPKDNLYRRLEEKLDLSFYNGGASKKFLTTNNTSTRLGELPTDRADMKQGAKE
jgi:hypothetical protein